ncbi:MAG: hypothetical protein KDE27_08710 [Planctomycetes bacterium]|nr:hypothetical protein [Planctomycetota bacterium]
MAQKAKSPRSKKRLVRNLALGLVALVAFLLLFVAAFVFNPFEGSVRDVRDLVPRGVEFFARKLDLADDFAVFPEPKFWRSLTETVGFAELREGALAQDLRRAGIESSIEQLRETFAQVERDSHGWVDLMRDLLGREIVVAGYMQDRSTTPARPLAEPHWCAYMRVTWRIKAALGLAGFGFVQSTIEQNGITIVADGDLLAVTPRGAPGPLYVKRHLDVLMVANDKSILDASQRLIDGNRDEEPLGQMANYTDGAVARIAEWGEDNAIDDPNVLEFVVEPNAFDGFQRFAAGWPNPAHKDSMNERVLASFVNLRGWLMLAGGVLFDHNILAATGQIVLNSKQHTAFQSTFYAAESKPREDWLNPFLTMVPQDACAAVGMRMPVGEFLHAMFAALEPAERDLANEMARRSTFRNEQLTDMNDLISRLEIAFLPRAGFVFRRNVPDMSRDDDGQLKVPVARRSPIPQIAWVFWLRPGSEGMLEDLIQMLRNSPGNFHIRKVWNLRVPFSGGTLPEPVWEFCNAQIPATGEVAMIVFREFFVMSNSGPLIQDILRTRYGVDNNRSIVQSPDFDLFERELPTALNAFVWLRGKNLVDVLDDYQKFAAADSERPDADWLSIVRPEIEQEVRRTKFPAYPSKASIPQNVLRGEFEQAVQEAMAERWRREKTNFSADDRAQVQQLRGMAQLLRDGYIQLELMPNYIRYQTKLLLNLD